MKILLISQYYCPTRIAASVRVERMARILSKKHHVSILTGFPTHNEKKLDKMYHRKLWQVTEEDKIKVVRTYAHFSTSNNFIVRMWNQISFMISSGFVGLFIEKPDLIIATSPPLFVGFSAACLSVMRAVPMIFDVRDLWPESMVVLGLLKNKFFIFLATRMANFVYRTAKVITVVTPQIQAKLQVKFPNKPIILLTNATDTNYFSPKKVPKEKFGFKENDVVISYVGIFSRAQALDKILEVAHRLTKEKLITFLFVGKGDDETRLFKLAENLKNVQFFGYQPKEEVLNIINMSDICLLPLAKNPLFSGAIPSKVFEYLACEKAVIASAQGDIEKIIINNQTGLIVPPESIQPLANAVLKLAKSSKLRVRLGKEGRKLIIKNYSEKTFSQKLLKIVSNQ